MFGFAAARRFHRRRRQAVGLSLAAMVGLPLLAVSSRATGQAAGQSSSQSRETGISVAGTQALASFDGVPYLRTWGTVSGVVAPGEDVTGLASLPKDGAGMYHYSANFEIMAPAAGQTANQTVLVEPENRGGSLLLGLFDDFPSPTGKTPGTSVWPPGMGNGFLFDHHISYARIQWQTGLDPTVPAAAEGVGEVIVRDFGRMLRGESPGVAASAGLTSYRHLLLGGWSQSAWFVDTLIAEGFNASPGTPHTRVYDGALTLAGAGNWLALNQLNGSAAEFPYLQPNARPLTAGQLLSRPATDPFLVDISNYTDFYRVRAGLFDAAGFPVAGMRHYDWPTAHGPAWVAPPSVVFSAMGCNAGNNPGPTQIEALNPLDSRPYMRALLLGLDRQVDPGSAPADAPTLPPDVTFTLGSQPVGPDLMDGNPALPLFNYLDGVPSGVPVVDANAAPVGGVRFPELDEPLGRLAPVSIPPVDVNNASHLCGNFGGYQPFSAAELASTYGSEAHYLSLYGASLDRLIAGGYLLSSDRDNLLAQAAAEYSSAP